MVLLLLLLAIFSIKLIFLRLLFIRPLALLRLPFILLSFHSHLLCFLTQGLFIHRFGLPAWSDGAAEGSDGR